MKKITTIYLAFVAVSLFGQTKSLKVSEPLTEGAASRVGISDDRLAHIEHMLHKSIERGDIPGAVALVARKGKIVFHQAFGKSDAETGREFKVDDIFRIASQTKAITSTAVMMLGRRENSDWMIPFQNTSLSLKMPWYSTH
jgi:CubicO group peptidase (beta-lactamase class C family)